MTDPKRKPAQNHVTRTFTHDELEDLSLDWSTAGDPIVSCEAYGKHRWYTVMRIVFTYEDALWQIERMDPATEIQEGQDIWSSDPVVATQVEPYEVPVIKYRPVSA